MIAHLSYVVCDVCGVPATQPVEGAKEARRLVPPSWRRHFDIIGRRVDLCPIHKPSGSTP